jgi:hypothetical protein
VLLLAALTGNWWAAAGWAFMITNALAAAALVALFDERTAQPPGGTP